MKKLILIMIIGWFLLFEVSVKTEKNVILENNIKTEAYNTECTFFTCNIYLSTTIYDENTYVYLYGLIENAPAWKTIYIHLSGTGGEVNPQFRFANAISASKANVVMIIEGPVYSSHAILAMLSNNVVYSANSLLMFHYPSVILNGQNILTSDIVDICKQTKNTFDRGQDAYKKCVDYWTSWNIVWMNLFLMHSQATTLLNKDEIQQIIEGKDIYINYGDLQKRLGGKL